MQKILMQMNHTLPMPLSEATRLVDAGKLRWAWKYGKLVLVEPDAKLGPFESFLLIPEKSEL